MERRDALARDGHRNLGALSSRHILSSRKHRPIRRALARDTSRDNTAVGSTSARREPPPPPPSLPPCRARVAARPRAVIVVVVPCVVCRRYRHASSYGGFVVCVRPVFRQHHDPSEYRRRSPSSSSEESDRGVTTAQVHDDRSVGSVPRPSPSSHSSSTLYIATTECTSHRRGGMTTGRSAASLVVTRPSPS